MSVRCESVFEPVRCKYIIEPVRCESVNSRVQTYDGGTLGLILYFVFVLLVVEGIRVISYFVGVIKRCRSRFVENQHDPRREYILEQR